MVTVHTDKVRRGKGASTHFYGFGFEFWERHFVFKGEGEMRTKGIGN